MKNIARPFTWAQNTAGSCDDNWCLLRGDEVHSSSSSRRCPWTTWFFIITGLPGDEGGLAGCRRGAVAKRRRNGGEMSSQGLRTRGRAGAAEAALQVVDAALARSATSSATGDLSDAPPPLMPRPAAILPSYAETLAPNVATPRSTTLLRVAPELLRPVASPLPCIDTHRYTHTHTHNAAPPRPAAPNPPPSHSAPPLRARTLPPTPPPPLLF